MKNLKTKAKVFIGTLLMLALPSLAHAAPTHEMNVDINRTGSGPGAATLVIIDNTEDPILLSTAGSPTYTDIEVEEILGGPNEIPWNIVVKVAWCGVEEWVDLEGNQPFNLDTNCGDADFTWDEL